MGIRKSRHYSAYLLRPRDRAACLMGPSLLLCPCSVVCNWRHGLERFAPELRLLVHHGGVRRTGADFALEAQKGDLVISSYALVHRDRDTLASVNWDGVVLDEAQNVKNPATLQARAVRSLRARYRF